MQRKTGGEGVVRVEFVDRGAIEELSSDDRLKIFPPYSSTGNLGVKLIELSFAETILSQKNCLIPILPLLPPVVSKPQKYSEPWPSLFRT